jgi:hypothetical protein
MAVIYVGNRPFPITPNPQAGDHYLGLDSSNGNRLTRQDSAGVVKDLESGLSYTDADAVAAIQAEITGATQIPLSQLRIADELYLRNVSSGDFFKVRVKDIQRTDPDRFSQIFDDFVGGSATSIFTSFVSGTGASHQIGTYGQDLTENAIGVLQSDTGTVSNGRAGLGTVSGLVARAGAARFVYEARHALEQLSTLTETFVFRCGLTDSFSVTGEGTNGLYFRYTDLQNGGRFLAVSRVAGTEIQAVDTGFSPDLDYHIYRVELSENGQQALFYIDDVLVATINAPNLPGGGNPFGAGFKIEKTVGATQRNMDTDWMRLVIERTSGR